MKRYINSFKSFIIGCGSRWTELDEMPYCISECKETHIGNLEAYVACRNNICFQIGSNKGASSHIASNLIFTIVGFWIVKILQW